MLDALASLWRLVVATHESWRDQRTIRLGAGLAYYGLFSLTSVLTMSLALVRLFGRSLDVEAAVADWVEELVGDPAQAAEIVATAFGDIEESTGAPIGLIGLGGLLITGSLFFLALEDAIHHIFGVPVRAGIVPTVRRRLVSLLVLIGACLTLLTSLAVQTASGFLEQFLPGSQQDTGLVSSFVSNLPSVAVLTGALVLLLRYVPTVDVSWRVALLGAVVTSSFLVIGTSLFGWYLRTIGSSSPEGAASTPIAILVWIYFEVQILLVGVQLTKVMHDRRSINGADRSLVQTAM